MKNSFKRKGISLFLSLIMVMATFTPFFSGTTLTLQATPREFIEEGYEYAFIVGLTANIIWRNSGGGWTSDGEPFKEKTKL